jgi:autotransporter-associated beta strand protein
MDRTMGLQGRATDGHACRARASWAPAVWLALVGAVATPVAANQWSYPGDPGYVARSAQEVPAARQSWETLEYGTFTGIDPNLGGTTITVPWQLVAVNASTAYALGYYGQGVILGMMDSGYRTTHQAFQTALIAPARGSGVYATSGFGYRNSATPGNPFNAGEPFVIDGDQARTSDYSHGTGMLGVTSGIRDGLAQHGIAFASKMVVAKTGGSDTQSHGPYHDYVYWYTANKALVDAGAQVINSSWGSFVQTLNRSQFDGYGNNLGTNGNLANGYQLAGRDSTSPTAMASIVPNEFFKDIEYQYFFTKKTYSPGGIQYNPNFPGRSFMDAIWDAIKVTGTVNVRSAGNNDWRNPYFRPAYPLFNPPAEDQFVAVGGVQPPTAAVPEYQKQTGFNEAGLAKWWSISTPSNNVRTSSSAGDTSYSNSSGTSPATPVGTAVMGVLLSRFPNMNAKQVREIMLTTANNKMTDGVRFLGTGQVSPSGEPTAWTAPDGLPDDRWGWGIPDLAKGVNGPGQFLSPMVYAMTKAPLDVWTNDIGQVAIKQREREDLQWLAGYRAQGVDYAGEYGPNVLLPNGTLSSQAFVLQGHLNDPAIVAITNGRADTYDKIPYADAVRWRKEWMDAKAAHIQGKIDRGQYTASLTKSGTGTLFLTGNNTYAGGTTVSGGKLSITGTNGSGVTVTGGGTLGGTGTVTGIVNVLGGGTLRPGVTSAETAGLAQVLATATVAPGDALRATSVRIAFGANFGATLKGGGVSTRLTTTGPVAIGGNLLLDATAAPRSGEVYTLIQASAIQGAFAGLPEGSVVAVAGVPCRISYQGGRVTLTATAQPT